VHAQDLGWCLLGHPTRARTPPRPERNLRRPRRDRDPHRSATPGTSAYRPDRPRPGAGADHPVLRPGCPGSARAERPGRTRADGHLPLRRGGAGTMTYLLWTLRVLWFPFYFGEIGRASWRERVLILCLVVK